LLKSYPFFHLINFFLSILRLYVDNMLTIKIIKSLMSLLCNNNTCLCAKTERTQLIPIPDTGLYSCSIPYQLRHF